MRTTVGSCRGRITGVVLLAFGAILPFFIFGHYLSDVQAAAPFHPPASVPFSSSLVISQVYGDGGNSGALYTNDFIELFNPTARQLPSPTGQFNMHPPPVALGAITAFDGHSPLAGQYYLIREAAGMVAERSYPRPTATVHSQPELLPPAK